jgi:hypothetical protein
VQALSPQLSAEARELALRLRARAARRLGTYSAKESMLPLAVLNELVADAIPGMARVPIPVLAPSRQAGSSERG